MDILVRLRIDGLKPILRKSAVLGRDEYSEIRITDDEIDSNRSAAGGQTPGTVLKTADLGKIRFPELLGLPPWGLIAILAAAAIGLRRVAQDGTPVGVSVASHP